MGLVLLLRGQCIVGLVLSLPLCATGIGSEEHIGLYIPIQQGSAIFAV